MLRTALLSIFLLAGALATTATVTQNFQVWTDEGARRLNVQLHPVPAPEVAIEGPNVQVAELPQLLAEAGGITIVDFIYTNCITICLALGSDFQQMQAALQAGGDLAGNSGVRLLSISFDGERDDPQTLAAYARNWKADPDYWRFVRVPQPEQQQELLHQMGVVVVPDGRGDFEHNAALLIFDAHGRMIRIFDMEERELALNYARHRARLHQEAVPAAS